MLYRATIKVRSACVDCFVPRNDAWRSPFSSASPERGLGKYICHAERLKHLLYNMQAEEDPSLSLRMTKNKNSPTLKRQQQATRGRYFYIDAVPDIIGIKLCFAEQIGKCCFAA